MAVGQMLILEARDFKDPQHWRWVLKDCQGKFLADHEVGLDPRHPNYSAFIDLEGFLKANSSPDRWLEDQIGLKQQVGSWIGREALGPVGERIAKFSTPVTIRVHLPPEPCGLLYCPGISDSAWMVLPERESGQARTAPECAQLLPRDRQAARGIPEKEAQAEAVGSPISALSGRAG